VPETPGRSGIEICQIAGSDDASPYVNSRPPYGAGVHAILCTLADPGACLSFRVPGLLQEWAEDHLFENGIQLQMDRIEGGEIACRRDDDNHLEIRNTTD
jgi:hypothetical protein